MVKESNFRLLTFVRIEVPKNLLDFLGRSNPNKLKFFFRKIAPPGFEPGSQAPKARILDHCTMGLSLDEQNKSTCLLKNLTFIDL